MKPARFILVLVLTGTAASAGARVVYKTPDVPRGTVVEGGVVTVLDPDGRRLATIGSQAAP